MPAWDECGCLAGRAFLHGISPLILHQRVPRSFGEARLVQNAAVVDFKTGRLCFDFGGLSEMGSKRGPPPPPILFKLNEAALPQARKFQNVLPSFWVQKADILSHVCFWV